MLCIQPSDLGQANQETRYSAQKNTRYPKTRHQELGNKEDILGVLMHFSFCLWELIRQEGKNNDMDPRSSMNETTGVGSYEENEWSITDGGMDENCLLRKSNVLQKKKTWIHGRLT